MSMTSNTNTLHWNRGHNINRGRLINVLVSNDHSNEGPATMGDLTVSWLAATV